MTNPLSYRFKNWFGIPVLILLDMLCIFAAMSLSLGLAGGEGNIMRLLSDHPHFLPFIILVTILSFYFFDLYYVAKDFRRFHQLVNLIAAMGIIFLIVMAIVFFDRTLMIGKRLLFLYMSFMFLFTVTVRSLFSVFHKLRLYKDAIVVGDNPITRTLIDALGTADESIQRFGIRLIGYISEAESAGKAYRDLPYLGSLENIDAILTAKGAQLIIYALKKSGDAAVNELLIKEKLRGKDLVSAIGLYQAISGRTPYRHIDSSWLIEECLRGQKFTQVRIKRLFDILLGAIFFALSFPVVALCGIVIMFESKGPALFTQQRIGRFGKLFTIYKLRTMTCGAERDTPARDGWGNLLQDNISKITRFGKFLRKYHIDELPQFYNVLRGDMSIVGPRPEMEMFTQRCEARIPFYRLRLAVRPGITGWAQVWFTHTSTLSGYKGKFEYDLYYLANLSLRLDLEIIIRTVFRLLGYPRERKGVFPVTE